MSVATFAWVLIGLVFVTVGLVAASKTGKRVAKAYTRQTADERSIGMDQTDRSQAALVI